MARMSDEANSSRRRLLVVLGAGAATVVGAPVGASLLAPVGETTVREGEEWVDVAAVDGILAGKPLRVNIRGDRHDAWTTFRNQELGSAFVIKRNDGSVVAFSSVCPHLGCAVGFSEQHDQFECPCHDAVFAIDGARVSGPAKRGLFELQSKVEAGRILVRAQRVAS